MEHFRFETLPVLGASGAHHGDEEPELPVSDDGDVAAR